MENELKQLIGFGCDRLLLVQGVEIVEPIHLDRCSVADRLPIRRLTFKSDFAKISILPAKPK